MKKHSVWILVAAMLLAGCSDKGDSVAPKAETPAKKTMALASWAFEFVTLNSQQFRMTSVTVPQVGKQLGEITSFSDMEASNQNGNFSNRYAVGTKLYEIPGTDSNVAIAVETAANTYQRAELVK